MKQKKALKKGLHLYEGKELSKDFPITTINASPVMVYPLSQHIGNPSVPVVKVGDRVITSKYAGTEVKIDGVEYSIVRQADILATIE